MEPFPKRVVAVAPAPAIPSRVAKRPPVIPWPGTVAPADPPPSQAASDSASGTEVCGFGRVPAATVPPDDINQYVFDKSQKTYQRWKASLLDSSNLRARAIGLLLQRGEHLRGDSVELSEVSRDELIQLAAGGSDPAVYALAVALCSKQLSDAVDDGACQRISLTEWARVDPGNAVPWMAVAQAARARGDIQAEAVAFARAAEARKMVSPGDSMSSSGLTEVPQDATALEKTALSIELIGYEAALVAPGLHETMLYCSAAAVKQDEIRKECSAVAELLVGPGTTLLYFSLGAKLGERAGWPAVRVTELTAEKEALMQLQRSDEKNLWSCDTVARMNAFVNERARIGELAALRNLRDQRDRVDPPSQ